MNTTKFTLALAGMYQWNSIIQQIGITYPISRGAKRSVLKDKLGFTVKITYDNDLHASVMLIFDTEQHKLMFILKYL